MRLKIEDKLLIMGKWEVKLILAYIRYGNKKNFFIFV